MNSIHRAATVLASLTLAGCLSDTHKAFDGTQAPSPLRPGAYQACRVSAEHQNGTDCTNLSVRAGLRPGTVVVDSGVTVLGLKLASLSFGPRDSLGRQPVELAFSNSRQVLTAYTMPLEGGDYGILFPDCTRLLALDPIAALRAASAIDSQCGSADRKAKLELISRVGRIPPKLFFESTAHHVYVSAVGAVAGPSGDDGFDLLDVVTADYAGAFPGRVRVQSSGNLTYGNSLTGPIYKMIISAQNAKCNAMSARERRCSWRQVAYNEPANAFFGAYGDSIPLPRTEDLVHTFVLSDGRWSSGALRAHFRAADGRGSPPAPTEGGFESHQRSIERSQCAAAAVSGSALGTGLFCN